VHEIRQEEKGCKSVVGGRQGEEDSEVEGNKITDQ
jgi:hypothetical protein